MFMIPLDWLLALWGGVLIGVAVSLMLLWNGRVTGISGIIYGALTPVKKDTGWRWAFVIGLFTGGITLKLLRPEFFESTFSTPLWSVVLAGLLVGFGTILGSGCTSGHGVCGISRLSVRSIIATLIFIFSGILTVVFLRLLGGMS